MLRRATPLIVVSSLLCTAIGSGVAGAQTTPPQIEDPMRAFSIVPPGQEGNVSDTELATGSFGAHYDDQLDMYAQLVNDDDVTEQELSKYFHSMQFGPQGGRQRRRDPVAEPGNPQSRGRDPLARVGITDASRAHRPGQLGAGQRDHDADDIGLPPADSGRNLRPHRVARVADRGHGGSVE